MPRRLEFRHRIGILLILAALALIAVTLVTLLLGRRSERELTGIETRYVPLIELDRDLKRIAAELAKAFEDAAAAGDETKLDEADQLRQQLARTIADGRQAIANNGTSPDALASALDAYVTSARALSGALVQGVPATDLGEQITAMQHARRAFTALLDRAASPDRARMAAAFQSARSSHRAALVIDIGVAAGALALMGLLSWWLIRRTVRSLRSVSEGVERLARGEFDQPIDVPEGDEIGDLAREANRTASRLREFRDDVERETQRANEGLVETRRQARAAETAAKELEAFSYSVSHDLRTPLRAIDGFSQALLEDEADRLTPEGADYLRRIRAAAQRMAELIDDLLRLSRVSRAEFAKDRVDLSALVRLVLGELRRAHPAREVAIEVQDGVVAYADPRLVRVALENLLGNAWKFTSKTADARIEFGARTEGDEVVFYVRDNGAGLDMTYADRLFGAFERLHSEKEFPGTGIGLATVQRIVRRHGGRIWVDAAVGKGATFSFTLPGDGARE